MIKLIKQAWSEMRTQPLIGWVTVAGTALAIFLIMLIVMMNQVKVIPLYPETYRDRYLHHPDMCCTNIKEPDWTASARMSRGASDALFMNLESAEAATTYCKGTGTLRIAKGLPIDVGIIETDNDYWRVFDFRFLAGAPYNEKSLPNSIVITRETAAKLFGSTEAAMGKEVLFNNYAPFTVVGVVDDVPLVATTTYAQAWMPLTNDHSRGYKPQLGDYSVTILARDPADFDAIRAEIEKRKAVYNTSMRDTEYEVDLLGGPFTQEVVQYKKWSNQAPDYEEKFRNRMILFGILLLVPAVNLSSMTQSRLRRRVSEIGVRRAFGCTRMKLIRGIITENFLITLAGGVVGLLASVLFAWLFADSLLLDQYTGNVDAHVSLGMLLNWRALLWALGFCFILNLLSSGIPAWRASRVNPVEAINKTRN